MRRLFLTLITAVVVVGGCGNSTKPPSAPIVRCEQHVAATLAPGVGPESFLHGEGSTISQAFLDRLAGYYSDPQSEKLCTLFTATGWQALLALDRQLFDSRFAALSAGDVTFDEQHILRLANEGDYNLRELPAHVPIDIVFDIPAGASRRDASGHVVAVTTSLERRGFHVDFTFDGRFWLANAVAPLGGDTQRWVALPTPVPPMGPCLDFVRDDGPREFDTDGTRRWCDGDGRGRNIGSSALAMFTKYPCETGHAAIVSVGASLGGPLDPLNPHAYVRDPAGEFRAQNWVLEGYNGDAELPADARYSGWTNGNIGLWMSPSEFERAVYMVRGIVVERWPRAAENWGVIDCN